MITLGELNRRHGIGKRKANRLIELGKLRLVSRSTERPLRTYVSEESVESFINEKADFEKTYILCKSVFKMLGLSSLIFYKYLEDREQLNANFTQEEDFFKIHELPENYYGISDQRYFFKRKDLEILQRDYITLAQAQELVGQKDNSGFSSWLQRRPQLQIFCFGEIQRNARFVKKSALLEVHQTFKPRRPGPQYDKEKYLSYKDSIRNLQLSGRYFKNLIQDKTLVPSKNIGRALFFEKEQVNALVKLQQQEYKRLSKDYMTYPKILTEYPDLNPDQLPVTKRIRRIELPALLSTIFKGENDQFGLGKYLYFKSDVKEYHEFITVKNAIHSEAIHSDPFSEYIRRIQINDLSFSDRNTITDRLWNEYAAEFLRSRQSLAYDVAGEIWCLIRVVEALTQLLDKEIFEYSSKELNLLFLNNIQIVRRAREEIYQFLLFVHKVFMLRQSKSPFQLEALLNPRKLQRENREKKVYNYFEYESFFTYVTDQITHKKSAVSQAFKLAEKKNMKQYNGYDSMWLYMLVHLNNAWRHSDCQLIPRISLEGTEIKNLQWLYDNDLSDVDVKKIIFRLKCTPMIVSKTQEGRNFFCASEVERPLATALAICELRTAAFNDDSHTIISGICNENGKMLKQRAKNVFFQEYRDKDRFSFSNRAMNRTVISLVQCVQAFYGNDKDTEYLRILRSHADIETTDVYILIPQERMDVIALHLFDRDMFGHIPDVISNLLFGLPDSESVQTNRIKEVKDNLGSIYNLEETAGFLNTMHDFNIKASRDFIEQHAEYKDIVEKLIKDMSPEEVHLLYRKIVTRQLPSKEEHHQCIVSESQCKFPGRDCGGCPLSIPHFYAISSLVERIFRKIQSIENALSEQLPEAELTRMANWLELDLDLLTYAQDKYGKQEVAMFATGINKDLQKIGFLRAYQTIKLTEVNS
ncbi:hypothetical protein C7121_13330 [Paenibacillus glucanolyticus]|jgi:hypothetical protein|uniref:hypothetical protein n=1 Tax=Paenibacillus glucanolyticus TaxID=59843 RepID=UPI000D1BCAE4|nr:hypothetical protein [Paenibacillus glucanolyticus]AVV57018.1 hypothetical protein C7121_13330 [Paenibacillus glucanolyticus]